MKSGKLRNEEDWKKVVAVIVDGPDWQFSNWPFALEVDLFSFARGYFLQFRKEPIKSKLVDDCGGGRGLQGRPRLVFDSMGLVPGSAIRRF